MVDKNQAMINYLITCPTILDSPLYFNFINAKNDTNQFVTISSDLYTNRNYIDGSIGKEYSFTIMTFKSATDIAVVKMEGFENENISDMATIQSLIDWISEQNENRNFPDFGEYCEVDRIYTTTDAPNFEGIDEQVSPPLVVYSTIIRVEYIDKSKIIWR